jgi:hypothetical protein
VAPIYGVASQFSQEFTEPSSFPQLKFSKMAHDVVTNA